MTRALSSPAPAVAGRPARPATRRVWDPLVRLFHWSLVASFTLAWFSEAGESLHDAAGYVVLGLVALRIVWGFVGSRHARFGDFVPRPRQLIAYLRRLAAGRAERYVGHNPAGGMMTLALLGMISAIAATGYMMTTDAYWGIEWVEELHEALVYGTLGLIALHIAGVIVTGLTHRENLVRAMITGRKRA